MISKTERNELRSIVKNQFKVLRAEVDQRKAELIAEAEHKILGRFRGLDQARSVAEAEARELMDEFNRKLDDLARKHDEPSGGVRGVRHISTSGYGSGAFSYNPDRRVEMRNALVKEIEAQVEGALLNLARQEADLLKTLAVGALESDEARAFLGDIPSVGELVPAARMNELEAALDDQALVDDEDTSGFGFDGR